MRLRWWIPLPGPVVLTPGKRKDPLRHVTDEQWDAVGRRIADGVQNHRDRMDRVAGRIEHFTEQVRDADQRDRDYHRDRMAELAEIRKLPAWPRFKAAMGFTVGRRHQR